MATTNEYKASSNLRWRKTQIECARKFSEAGDVVTAKKCVRAALVLSFNRREALRELREGRVYERSYSTRSVQLEDYLQTHRHYFS